MDVALPSDAELEQAPLLVRSCISHNKTMQETMDILFANLKIPPPYTRAVWKALESEIPEVFEAYYARMNLMFPNHNNNNPDIYNGIDYMNENQQLQWFEFVDWVVRCIQDSMELNMTKLATITSIHTVHKVLPVVTRAVWEVLEKHNPQLFQDYYARLQQHHNGAQNGMHNQNGGELVAPNEVEHQNQQPQVNNEFGGDLELMIQHLHNDGAQNGMHNQNGGELVAPNDVEHQNQQPQVNIEYGGELELMIQHLHYGAQNGMHDQNGGGLAAPNAAQNGMHNQNGGELVAPNAAQNGLHNQNGRALVAPNAEQNGGELVAPHAAQNGRHHANDVDYQRVNNGNGVDYRGVNGHI